MPKKEDIEDILGAVKNKTYPKPRLEISYQVIKADYIRKLFLALNDYGFITHLELFVCSLKVEEARAIADGLVSNSTIRSLRLNQNNIGDDGARLIADAIRQNKTLKSLYLSFNDIGEEGARYLYNAACQNRNIIQIDLNFDHLGEKIMRPLMEENRLLRKKLALNFLTKAVTAAAARNLEGSPARVRVPSMFDLAPNIADFLYGHGIFGQEKFWQQLQSEEVKPKLCEIKPEHKVFARS